jgi:pimeloyl-ACP methyl ester carboxylesterase
VPTGTYVDMCSNLPVCDPEKITVPTLIMRGEYDGIASFSDLLSSSRSCPIRQAVRRHAGYRACLVPPEELRHLLPHPGELLFAARADLQERALMPCHLIAGGAVGRR